MNGIAHLVSAPPDGWGAVSNSEHSAELRHRIGALAPWLARGTDSYLLGVDGSNGGSQLVVVVLRGGALLYRGFAERFNDADICMVAVKREETGAPVCQYMTDVPRTEYATTIYVDCVAATGATVLAVRSQVTVHCEAGHEVASVLCSSTVATDELTRAGLDVIGFSLNDGLQDGVVLPDLGAADAGDLFSSATPPRRDDGG